jgi:hypothetical protein
MSHYSCTSRFLYAGTLPGVSKEQGTWLSFVGSYAECGKLCRDGQALFCANFSAARGFFSPCRKVWCGKCYWTPAGLVFPIRTPKDEAGFEHVVDGDQDRFKCASNGTNGVCPFQCDLCHFRNIQGRNPRPLTNRQDGLAMDCIWRTNLDAIWAREPSTIA